MLILLNENHLLILTKVNECCKTFLIVSSCNALTFMLVHSAFIEIWPYKCINVEINKDWELRLVNVVEILLTVSSCMLTNVVN